MEGMSMEQKENVQYVELAYARVSSKEQHLERQEQSIYEAVPGLKAMYFFEDKWTGKDFANRPNYNRMKEKVEELLSLGQSVRITFHELDRIGRDYKEILDEVYSFRMKGVTLRFLDIPDEMIGTETGIGGQMVQDIIITYKAFVAEQELKDKHKRTMEGIARAKASGVKFGRTPIEVDEKAFRSEADRAINRYITHKEAMGHLGLTNYKYWSTMKHLYPDYKPNKKKVKR